MAETPLDRGMRVAIEAYNRIRAPGSVSFDDLDPGSRCLALAAAMLAEDPLLGALRSIADMETPWANATVKRMATAARAALGSSTPPTGD